MDAYMDKENVVIVTKRVYSEEMTLEEAFFPIMVKKIEQVLYAKPNPNT
ncbi:hypothetical protein FACS1894188_03580 [Clostridia bacterium]|nr:hypothetical protein FACS1894188_03580 [Clostridia bacterium]